MTTRSGATLLILLAATVAFGACASSGASPASNPSPTASASAAPSVAPSPSAEPSTPAEIVPQLPVQPCCSEMVLEAGPYALPGWLGPLLKIEVDDGWGVVNDASARYLVFGTGDNSVGTMSSLVTLLGTPNGTAVADVIAALQGTSTLAFDGEPGTASIAEFDSTVLQATAMPNPDRADDPGSDIAAGTVDLDPLEAFVEPGFALTTSTPEARLRFHVIEIDGRVVIAMLEAPAAEADAFFGSAETLLGTLERQ